MIDVLTNHRELQIESNSVRASCIRFYKAEIRKKAEPVRGAIGNRRVRDTYHALVFVQHLVVLAKRDEEHQGGNVFEAVDPLLPLGTLSSDVEDLVRELAYFRIKDIKQGTQAWQVEGRKEGRGDNRNRSA